ncbi:MAG: glycosyltransferase [bacterium]
MKYTITIPAYKAKFLSKCIDSILAQTHRDFELIIVNDASTEDLDSIVNSYDDSRIKYYTNEKNCGAIDVVDNWNICLSYATGDYVICMGDDDELAPDCLEQYSLLLEQYPDLDIYHGRVKVIDEESEFVNLQEVRPAFESVYSMMWYRMNGRIQYIGDFLYKRSTLNANGGFYKLPLAWGSDDISAYIAAKDKGIANTEKPIFYYRTNPYTITKSGNMEIKIDAIEAENEWLTNFIEVETSISEVDQMYIKMLKQRKNKHYAKKKLQLVAADISNHNIFRCFYWLTKNKSFSFAEIMYALIESVKIKRK